METQMVHKYFNNVCMAKTMGHDKTADIHILRENKEAYIIKHVTYEKIVEEINELKDRMEA